MSEVKQKIRSYFENLPAYVDNPFQLKDDDSVIKLGLIDSFGIVELVSFLVQTFDVEVEPEDMERKNFESIIAMQRLIEAKLQA